MDKHPIIYKYPMRFPKINTLFMRDPERKVKRKGVIMPGHFSEEAFRTIKYWTVTEKIHGKNTRIFIDFIPGNLNPPSIWIGSRNDTDTPQLGDPLLKHIYSTIDDESLLRAFTKGSFETDKCPRYAMIFGEGVGPGINQAYGNEPEFIIFDVVIDNWFIRQPDVQDISERLGFRSVPVISNAMRTESIIDYVQAQKNSLLTNTPYIMGGVVCTSSPLLLTRNGTPVRFKLKTKDFRDLESERNKHE